MHGLRRLVRVSGDQRLEVHRYNHGINDLLHYLLREYRIRVPVHHGFGLELDARGRFVLEHQWSAGFEGDDAA
jgi:hypothetical protein